jgi:hypothetical protein
MRWYITTKRYGGRKLFTSCPGVRKKASDHDKTKPSRANP